MEPLFVKFCSTGHRGFSLKLIQIQILKVLNTLGNIILEFIAIVDCA